MKFLALLAVVAAENVEVLVGADPAKAGEACSADIKCVDTCYCDLDNTKKCITKPAKDGACSAKIPCASGLTCDPKTSKCVDAPAGKQLWDKCTVDSKNKTKSDCAATFVCATGTCSDTKNCGDGKPVTECVA